MMPVADTCTVQIATMPEGFVKRHDWQPNLLEVLGALILRTSARARCNGIPCIARLICQWLFP
jgi:hypothetical protein